MKKRFLIVVAALFCAVSMNAQPGGMGGFDMMGGMGMMGGMSFDPVADMRAQMADQKTTELEELLGLTAKQSKKVYKVYNHIDSGSQSTSSSFSGMGGFDMMGGMGMMGGFPGGSMGAPDMEGGMKMPSMPVSAKEKAWREKKMSKILDYEQFRKWQEYEAKAAAEVEAETAQP